MNTKQESVFFDSDPGVELGDIRKEEIDALFAEGGPAFDNEALARLDKISIIEEKDKFVFLGKGIFLVDVLVFLTTVQSPPNIIRRFSENIKNPGLIQIDLFDLAIHLVKNRRFKELKQLQRYFPDWKIPESIQAAIDSEVDDNGIPEGTPDIETVEVKVQGKIIRIVKSEHSALKKLHNSLFL